MVLVNETKGCLEEERKGLLAFKAFFETSGEDAEYLLPSWVEDRESECCGWERVTCDSSTGHVTELFLSMTIQTSLDGNTVFNLSLFQPFKNLKLLNLSSNGLVGWNQNEGKISSLLLTNFHIFVFFPFLFLLFSHAQIIYTSTSMMTPHCVNSSNNNIAGSDYFPRLSMLETLDLSNNSLNNIAGSNKDLSC